MGIYNPINFTQPNTAAQIDVIAEGETINMQITTTKGILLTSTESRGKLIIWNTGNEDALLYFGNATDAAMKILPNGYFIDEYPASIGAISAKTNNDTTVLTVTQFARFVLNATPIA
ncbi:hypothetical protein DSM106972_025340 [Dulcicalothrix desertica PCC 7102]|uniref:Uncharacterized protein n=1 Tax=Dulcicalothrix desertica PCC 7102 TaxID=232991 RepID=A0A3S1AR33_9CYAN|nr:hypothetical protein [Dulcicalothrix desertica]RUT07273.1 hypothetical protein DSM106972_025340 [Dulcicalothrix desertica PCC 7102]TWH55523.1 hypothetical protein CAL7102_03667 [Dulcicalothrix desertica PCC 7102]